MKAPSFKFCGNPSSGSHANKCVQTDGFHEVIGRFLRLCERVLITVVYCMTPCSLVEIYRRFGNTVKMEHR